MADRPRLRFTPHAQSQHANGFEDGFLDLVEEQLKRSRQELSDLEQKISQLQNQRADTAKRVAQLEDLLHSNRTPAEQRGSESSSVPLSRPRRPIADAVIDLIRQSDGPMHYLDIHTTLVERGYQIGGQGNAATLLSRYSNDPRLTRVARGTYDTVDRRPDPRKGLDWNGKRKTIQLPGEDNSKKLFSTRASQPLPSDNVADQERFTLRFIGFKATAIYSGKGKMRVLRGSQARKDTTALGTGTEKTLAYRARLVREGTLINRGLHYELTRDVEFENPSIAAKVMSGASKNGWVEWMTADGRTLDDVHRR